MSTAKSPASFGTLLSQARGRLNITASELARRVGCGQPTIWLLERDKRNPSVTLARRLASCLGIEVAELFGSEK